ncbi:CBO0543 family protein [Pelosinus sp. UFO1]|uniref:CBO0543 family protein n=1 Tax=Pelosinus sp. UFO1 TaxID=484770 RepID=UPI000B2E45B3|nr:CBO0543 family protein [Pelosinus sp. UFO1]
MSGYPQPLKQWLFNHLAIRDWQKGIGTCTMQNYPTNEQLAEMGRILTQARIENWFENTFGSWRWWVLVVLLIFPWFIWAKIVDKKKLHELALFGLLIMVSSITLDEVGFVLSLWNYPINVIPIFPRLTSADYTAIPIIYMLIYQYFAIWKSFLWALIVISVFFSFVIEPSIMKLGFYVLINWSFLYSFILYLVVGLSARWLTKLLVNTTHKYNTE